jgi:hypothetical protein
MVKTRKTNNLRKRSRKGGDTMNTLALIKTKNNMIMAKADEKESDECVVSEIKEFAMDEAKLINELIQQEQEKENMQVPGKMEEQEEEQKPQQEPVQESPLEPEPEPMVPSSQTVVPLMQQQITISGFTGTVGGLLSSIRDKIGQLRKQTGQSYKDSVNKLTMVTKKLSDSTTTNTDQIKQILKENQITFKNNKLFGGKTKKRRGGRKSKRHTKRR